tara:strand:+ start:48 stop:1268 length:1221 start_codon:yes stop_codon:yes gene_type:complete
MNTFFTFLTEAKNTHLEHLEDDIINNGTAGGRNAIAFLVSLMKMLEGKSKRKMDVTVKWDGAPAIFAGTNPDNGKFFVGTKSIFNKTPKINYTNADIDANHGGGLADKLKAALKYFPRLNIPGIWQGDLLYTDDDLSETMMGGQNSVVFTPNTITYAVPLDTSLASRILRSKIGVVWHTTYTGKTMTSLKAKFGANASSLANTRAVWSTDATFRDTSGNVTFTAAESTKFQRVLNMASGSLKKAAPFLKVMDKSSAAESLPYLLKIFLNSYIRGGEKIQNTSKVTAFFSKWLESRMDQKIKSVKSTNGKKKWQKHKKVLMSEYNKYKKELYFVIATYITLQTAKTTIIRKLEKAESIGTFIKTSNGYRVTAPEGFVAIDRVGKALKLVDRLEFSKANFTVDKNWKG